MTVCGKVSAATLKAVSSKQLVSGDAQVISDIVVLDGSGENMVETHLLLDDSACASTTQQLPFGAARHRHGLDLSLSLPAPDPDNRADGEKTSVARTAQLPTKAPHKSQVADVANTPGCRAERQDTKASPGTSEELDDLASSEGFATADFFIDESMPSSMTESSPSKKIAELQGVVQDNITILEAKDRELQGKTAELQESQTILKNKDSELNRMREQLKEVQSLLELREGEVKDKDRQLAICQEQVESAQRDLSQNRDELVNCQKRVASDLQEREQIQDKLIECQRKLAACQMDQEQTSNQLEESQEKLVSCQREQKETRAELQSREAILKSKDSELDSYKELLSAKETQLERHGELEQQLKLKATQAEGCLRVLQEVTEKGILQLKGEVLNLEKQTGKERDDFQGYVEVVGRQILDVIQRFEEQQLGVHNSAVQSLKDQHGKVLADLQRELDLAKCKASNASGQLETCKHQLEEKTTECEKLKQELTTTHNQLVLESELEMERVKAELVGQLENLERQKENIAEELCEQFQQEKDKLVQILKAEHQQEVKALESQLQSSRSQEMETLMVQAASAKTLQEKCQKLENELEVKQNVQTMAPSDAAADVISLRTHEAEIAKLKTAHEAAKAQASDNNYILVIWVDVLYAAKLNAFQWLKT